MAKLAGDVDPIVVLRERKRQKAESFARGDLESAYLSHARLGVRKAFIGNLCGRVSGVGSQVVHIFPSSQEG